MLILSHFGRFINVLFVFRFERFLVLTQQIESVGKNIFSIKSIPGDHKKRYFRLLHKFDQHHIEQCFTFEISCHIDFKLVYNNNDIINNNNTDHSGCSSSFWTTRWPLHLCIYCWGRYSLCSRSHCWKFKNWSLWFFRKQRGSLSSFYVHTNPNRLVFQNTLKVSF
jgi:hypothetical protein